MCGLVGIASVNSVLSRDWLISGRDSMTHRGPDDAGVWWSGDGLVGLAHRRLAIHDLTSAGHQPMRDELRGLAIVFNGEIYNFCELRAELEERGYSFHSSTDTEVLLAAYDSWGAECLSRLDGMFSFSIYDERKKVVFLARDRAGEKPLFYHLTLGVLRFASELKALMADHSQPRRIDTEALDCYLAMGYVPGNRCILEGYNKLPPAHALSFDLARGTTKVWRYWMLPDLSPEAVVGQVDEGSLLDELETLLESAVRRQLVADVPVGVLLSGGVDSSLITAMAVRCTTKVKTFSVGFPGYGSLDESSHARLIARHFGTEHTELTAEPTSADLIPLLAKQFDEPMVDSSMIPTYILSQLVREHCTVALGGDGGDELFGGYDHYSRLLWMQRRLEWIPRSIRQPIASVAGRMLPLGFGGGNIRTWIQGMGDDLRGGLPLVTNFFDARTRCQLLSGSLTFNTVAEDVGRSFVPANPDLLQRATRMDFSTYLAEDILVKVDRASMLNSLELRAPLLDRRLIEFAYGRVPSNLKATPTAKKILLKQLTHRLLPRDFDRKRKQGFSIPLNEWLKKGPFRDLFYDVLLDQDCTFHRPTVAGLLHGQERGRSNGERLFALVHFEMWRRHYSIAI